MLLFETTPEGERKVAELVHRLDSSSEETVSHLSSTVRRLPHGAEELGQFVRVEIVKLRGHHALRILDSFPAAASSCQRSEVGEGDIG
jgi:hypothetical protein